MLSPELAGGVDPCWRTSSRLSSHAVRSALHVALTVVVGSGTVVVAGTVEVGVTAVEHAIAARARAAARMATLQRLLIEASLC